MHQFPQEHSEWKKKERKNTTYLSLIRIQSLCKKILGGGGQNEVYVLHVLPAQGKLVLQQVT